MCLTVLLGQCSGTRQVSLNKLSILVSYSHSITRVAAKGTKKICITVGVSTPMNQAYACLQVICGSLILSVKTPEV